MKHLFIGARGFSLVEVLVYCAITVLTALVVVETYLSLDTVLIRNATERALNRDAQVALERLGQDIRAATMPDTVKSTFGTSSSTLVLVNGATSTKFSVATNTLMLTVNNVVIGPLTSSSTVVEEFVVHRYVGVATELIRVTLTLSAQSKAASTTRTYYTSAVLRGSYE